MKVCFEDFNSDLVNSRLIVKLPHHIHKLESTILYYIAFCKVQRAQRLKRKTSFNDMLFLPVKFNLILEQNV